MCKIAIIPHVAEDKQEAAWDFAVAMTNPMTRSDRDGFGYMAMTDRGLTGQRWLEPREAWEEPPTPTKREKDLLNGYGDWLSPTGKQDPDMQTNRFGHKEWNRLYSLVLHSRMATGANVELKNVHPFVSKERKLGIVHNGMIQNHHLWDKKASTCDSEAILLEYEKQGVANDFKKLHKVVDKLSGWYAVAAFAKNDAGNWFLDVFRDGSANLDAVFIPELDTYVFCTRKDLIFNACKKLKWETGKVFEVKKHAAVRHDALTGMILERMDIASATRFYSGSHASWGSVDEYDERSWGRVGPTALPAPKGTGSVIDMAPTTQMGAASEVSKFRSATSGRSFYAKGKASYPNAETFCPPEIRAHESKYDQGEADASDAKKLTATERAQLLAELDEDERLDFVEALPEGSEKDEFLRLLAEDALREEMEFNQGGGLHDERTRAVDDQMRANLRDPFFVSENPGYG